jgi:hypothetical protein
VLGHVPLFRKQLWGDILHDPELNRQAAETPRKTRKCEEIFATDENQIHTDKFKILIVAMRNNERRRRQK